jgi:hypothetical protein
MKLLLCSLAWLILMSLGGVRASGEEAVPSAKLAQIREASRELARDVEYLQDALVSDAAGPKEREAYRKVDALRDRVDAFLGVLKSGISQADLDRRFDQMDEELEAVLAMIPDLAARDSALDRAARYARASEAHLEYLLADGVPARRDRAVTKQAASLAEAAAALHRAATHNLDDDSPSRVVLLADLQAFRGAADEFLRQLTGKSAVKDPKQAFRAVHQAWSKVVLQVKRLPAQAAASLARTASRVDRLHERLFRLLQIEGDRPGLTVPT